MRLKPDQLEQHLQRALAPVYLISGDEPQQSGEMADAIRSAAKRVGFEAREIFSEETGIDWNALTRSAGSLSIFSDKKIIDLRLPSGKPGMDGAKTLAAYCGRVPEETLLLVSTGKLAAESQKSRWFQALDRVGVIIQVRPLEGQELIRWLQQKAQRRGLQLDQEGIRLLASRIEGNLLAAVQEIEKLYVLCGAGRIDSQQILDVVADSARYDVFKLVDSVLSANLDRLFRIVPVLKAEGIAAPIVLWALTREARTLIGIKQALSQGQNRDALYRSHQVWDKRQHLVGNALDRLSQHDLYRILEIGAAADRQIKGQDSGDPWETLLNICLVFAGADDTAQSAKSRRFQTVP
ncbi:MAG: DNA polymerase III subunit delta [Gammaproteobacteria bacterium]